uniref:Uncharacterized protein n=1 Tax=Arundo donax TaxID=35708 RepID=A0A0A9AXV6_ARUDO
MMVDTVVAILMVYIMVEAAAVGTKRKGNICIHLA